MQTRDLFLILLIGSLLFSCKSEQKKRYEAKVNAFAYYKNEYLLGFPDKNVYTEYGVVVAPVSPAESERYRKAYSDSVLIILNEIENMDLTPGQMSDNYMRKADIYYEEGDYHQAIKALGYVSRGLPFVQMQDILINKLKVKEAQINADSLVLDSLYRVILKDYQDYYDDDDVEMVFKITFRKKDGEKAFHSWANLILVEILHYKMLLEGRDRVLEQIDSLQVATKGNQEYFDRLKELFIQENYQIIFE